MDEYDRRDYMRQAYRAAYAYSHDRSTNNGAVLIPEDVDEYGVSVGANRFARGVREHDDANHEKPLKYKLMVHAERDVIFDAAHDGTPTDGATMVCPWAPCPECAQAIIQSGIVRLVTHRDRHDQTPDRWKVDVDLGLKMLDDAGVEVVWLEGPVNAGVTILFDGAQIAV